MISFRRTALVVAAAVVIPACGDPVSGPAPGQIPVPASTEYPHALVKESVFDAGTGKEYRLYEPDGPPLISAPVVVFLHGWGGTDPAVYRPWIDHLARRGNVVLWVRYQESILTLSLDFVPNMLQAVKAGLARLEQEVPARPKPELDRLAVVGHSMGGVLAMTLAARAAEEGLPQFKAVMMANPGTGVTGPEVLADYSKIPSSTLLVGVSGEEDTLGTAAPQFFTAATAVPLENKDHVLLKSDRRFTPPLVADHFAPNSVSEADVNALDRNGYWKWFDGLTAAAFYGRYREYALGDTPEQRFMGTWPDGTPILEPVVSDAP